MRKYFQRFYFCELSLENCKFHGRYFVNTNQIIKFHLTLVWQCSCFNLIFPKRHFRKLATKSQKHLLVKISSTKMSDNIYNRNLRNDARSMFKVREIEVGGGWVVAGAYPDYIHLCKCWSHIFSDKKLLKNTGITIFSTKFLSSFLLPIEETRILRPRVGRGYSAVFVERLCKSAMR